MKKKKLKNEFLEQLRKIPIVLVACEKTGLSRTSVYRWRKEDKEFEKEMDQALKDGIELVNDMSESQLLTLIKEKNWPAISFWLKHHHSAYRNRIEVTTPTVQEELTKEQEEIVREALRLASGNLEEINKINLNSHENTNNTDSITRSDDEGSKDPNINNKGESQILL
jgi:hypothetical protein